MQRPDSFDTAFSPEFLDREAPVHAGLVGGSRSVQRLLTRIRRLAKSTVPVLVRGETGAGKENVARALHLNSPRSSGPFVAESAGALSDPLVLRRMFGHVRGAFTGATQSVPGLFELADGGTLYLDEVSDLPETAQIFLLRAVEGGSYRPLGSPRCRRSDFRLVASTSRDLAALVAAGTFRRELYLRLRGALVDVPPLRERRADIPELARRCLVEEARLSGRKRPLALHPAAQSLLLQHDWPGNVRELRQELFQAAALADGAEITPDLFLFVAEPLPEEPAPTVRRPPLRRRLHDVESAAIEQAIKAAGGNKTEAARRLGMTRRTLYRRLEEMRRGRTPAPGGAARDAGAAPSQE